MNEWINKQINKGVLLWHRDPGIVASVAWVTAGAWVWSLAQELPHAMGVAKTKQMKI